MGLTRGSLALAGSLTDRRHDVAARTPRLLRTGGVPMQTLPRSRASLGSGFDFWSGRRSPLPEPSRSFAGVHYREVVRPVKSTRASVPPLENDLREWYALTSTQRFRDPLRSSPTPRPSSTA